MAELSRLKILITEQSFLQEIATQLSLSSFELPDIPIIVSKDYMQGKQAIARALWQEKGNNIESAIATLCLSKPTEYNVNMYY